MQKVYDENQEAKTSCRSRACREIQETVTKKQSCNSNFIFNGQSAQLQIWRLPDQAGVGGTAGVGDVRAVAGTGVFFLLIAPLPKAGSSHRNEVGTNPRGKMLASTQRPDSTDGPFAASSLAHFEATVHMVAARYDGTVAPGGKAKITVIVTEEGNSAVLTITTFVTPARARVDFQAFGIPSQPLHRVQKLIMFLDDFVTTTLQAIALCLAVGCQGMDGLYTDTLS